MSNEVSLRRKLILFHVLEVLIFSLWIIPLAAEKAEYTNEWNELIVYAIIGICAAAVIVTEFFSASVFKAYICLHLAAAIMLIGVIGVFGVPIFVGSVLNSYAESPFKYGALVKLILFLLAGLAVWLFPYVMYSKAMKIEGEYGNEQYVRENIADYEVSLRRLLCSFHCAMLICAVVLWIKGAVDNERLLHLHVMPYKEWISDLLIPFMLAAGLIVCEYFNRTFFRVLRWFVLPIILAVLFVAQDYLLPFVLLGIPPIVIYHVAMKRKKKALNEEYKAKIEEEHMSYTSL